MGRREREYIEFAVLLFVVGTGSVLMFGGMTGTATAETTAPACSDIEFNQTDGYFEIENVTQLQCIGNESAEVGLDDDYVLVNDIDASETETWHGGKGFEPVGTCEGAGADGSGDPWDECNEAPSFKGTFDGQSNTISNLTIDRPNTVGVGLFGAANEANVSNVRLTNASITGSENTAGIAGQLLSDDVETGGGFVKNVSVEGTIEGGLNTAGIVGHGWDIDLDNENVFVGTVTGSDEVGGILGRASGSTAVSTSYAQATVEAKGEEQGREYDGDAVAGGLVGNSGHTSDFSEVYTVGDVTGDVVGAIVGDGAADTFENVYWNTDEGPAVAAGGYDDPAGVEGLQTEEMQGSTAEESMAFDWTDTWQWVAGDYPVFQWEADAVEDGEPSGIDAADVEHEPNSEGTITVTVTDEFGNPVDGETVTVETNGDGLGGIAVDQSETTDSNGEATFSFGESNGGEYTVEFSAEDSSITDTATVTIIYAGGEGTNANPYEIENWHHLDNVRENLDSEFVLTNDLTKETGGYDEVAADGANGGNGFLPIAECFQSTRENEVSGCDDDREEFTGTFDGATHTISNLTIDRSETIGVGLFGIVEDGVIENLRLESVDITGDELVGGITGGLYKSSGSPSPDAAVVQNVSVTGDIAGSGPNVAGLVGHGTNANLTFMNAFRGSVTGSHEVGGILGRASGDTQVSFTYARADVTSTGGNGDWTDDAAGGIVGDSGNSGSFAEIYFNGTVDAAGSNEGAIVGAINDGGEDDFTNVYWNSDFAPADGVGGGGTESTENYTSLTTDEMQGSAAEANMVFDWNDTWQTVASDYPVFQWEADASGEGSTAGIEARNVTETEGVEGEITVVAEDEFGNAVEGETITVVSNSSLRGLAEDSTAQTDANGEATFTFGELSADDYTLEFAWDGDDEVNDTATVTVEAADANTHEITNVPDSITAGDEFELTVNATDEYGNPAIGQTLENVEVSSEHDGEVVADGSLELDEYGGVVMTVEAGEVTTADDEHGLSVDADDVDSDETTVAVDSANATAVSVLEHPDSTQFAGEVITPGPIVNTTDEFGNPVEGVTVSVEAIDGDGAITAGEATATTDEYGNATFDDLVIETADEFRLEFSIDDSDGNVDSNDENKTESFDVASAEVESVELDPDEVQTITAGEGIAFNATAYDTFGNTNETVDSEFTWTNTTAEGVFENTTAGTHEVSVEFAGVVNTTTVTVEPAAVETVELDTSEDQQITAGEILEFNATAYDEFGNVNETDDTKFTWTNTTEDSVFKNTTAGTHEVTAELSGAENTTTVTVESAAVETVELDPSEDQQITAGETLEFTATAYDEFGNTNETDDHAFTWTNTTDEGIFENTTAGTHDVSAELAGVENSTTVTVDPAGAHQIVAFDLDTDEIAFGAGEATVNATIEDEYGNRIVDKSDVLTLSLEGATESAADTVENVGTDNDGNAMVTVAGDGDLSPTVGDLTVAANLTNEADDDTADLTVVPDDLESTFASESSQAGEEVDFEVELQDHGGNSLEDGDVDRIDVEIELADAPEGYDGEAELEGEEFATESSTVTIDVTEAETTPAFNSTLAGEYELEATVQPDATTDVKDTDSLSIEAADANEVTVETQPEDAVAGESIAGPPTANVTDEFGNPVPEESVTVDVDGSAALAGETDGETNESGLVEFDDLHITDAGSYELTFELEAGSSVAVTTDPFDVDPAEPDTLEADDVTETAGFENELTATLTDAFDNPIPEESLTVTDTDGLKIDEQNQTDDAGNSTFAFTEHSTGEYNVTIAADADETVNTSATVAIERAAVEDLELDIDDSEITTAGTTQLTVTATYANETTREVTEAATLTSNATDIATIDDDGVVSGVGDGVANLSAEYYEGENSTTLDVIDESVDASASANTYTPSIRSDGETRDVRFRANASEYPGDDPTVTWRWEEDGTEQTATGEVHETTFSTPETVTVEFEVTARGETDTDTMNLTVNDPLSPDARLDVPESIDVDESFTVDACDSTDNVDIAEYAWDFGNGTTASGADLDALTGSYSDPGIYDVELTVIDTSGNEDTNTTSVMVKGANATIPNIPLEFGEVGNGSSTSMSIPVENDGTTPLEFTDDELSGENASAFDVTGVNNLVDPDETHRLDVAFTPTEVGKKTAELELETNSTGEDTVTIDLTGVGVESDLTPEESTVGFGDVDVGTQEEREVTIENEGGESTTITDVAVGEDAFEVVDAPDEIDAGESEPVTVAFEPETDGAESTTLRVEAENDSTSVSLTGTGLGPEIRLNTDDLEFETTGINTTTTETVEIRNTGNYDLDIEQATVSGSDTEAFSVVSEPDVVGAGESETLELQFEPEDPVEHTGTLTLENNDTAAGAQIVDLSGDAVAADIGIDSTSIDFGVTEAGTSYYETVTVSNDGGTDANLTVDDLRIVGSHPDVFDVDSPETPHTLEPGDEQEIVLNLTTDVEEPRRAQLQIHSDAANQPQTNVWLSNERGYIVVQEVSNPTVNIDGTDLEEGSEHLINVSTSSTQASDVTIDELEMTMEKSDFEMDLSNAEDPFDNELGTDSDTTLLQYIELAHISGDPDEAFDETAVHYRVDVDAVPDGATGEDVSLHRYNDSDDEWAELDAQFLEERGGHYHYEVETPGFSEFAVTAQEPSSPSLPPTPDPEPESNITVTAAVLEEATITKGETATVTVILANDGDADGVYTLELTADGAVVGTETVTVDAGETSETTISFVPEATGEYELETSEVELGTLLVEAEPPDVPESNITVTAAMLEEATITEGEVATVTVTLENDGDADGNYTLEITADGTALATESVAVDAGETTNTTLSIAPDAGEYDLELNGQDVETLVVEPDPADSDDDDPADDDDVADDDDPADDSDEEGVGTVDDDGTSSWILLLLGALGGTVLLFVLLWRRREGEDETDGQSSTE